MTVDITPEELGPVRVHVELRDGNVELRLAGHSEAARDALRAALPDLRRALEAAGVGTGAFQISPDSPPSQDRPNQNSAQQHLLQSGGGDAAPRDGGHPRDGHARPAWAGPEGRAPHLSDHAVPARTGPAGSLDLQL
jgi:flagellar hook-length control protein FliK